MQNRWDRDDQEREIGGEREDWFADRFIFNVSWGCKLRLHFIMALVFMYLCGSLSFFIFAPVCLFTYHSALTSIFSSWFNLFLPYLHFFYHFNDFQFFITVPSWEELSYIVYLHLSKRCLGVVKFPSNLPSKNPLDCCSLVFPYFFCPTIPPISNVHFASSRLPFFPFSIRLSLHPATLAPQSIPAPTASLHPSVCPTLPPFIQVLI